VPLSKRAADPRLACMWDSRSLMQSEDWRMALPDAVVEEFSTTAAALPRSPERFNALPSGLSATESWASDIREILVSGPGLCVISGVSRTPLDRSERRRLFAFLSLALGRPLRQYGLLYPIQDRGLDHTKEAVPVSMTCAETRFHSDSSSVDANPDVLGLLCETPSRNGGQSQVSNALRIYHLLRQEAPEVLRILKRPFIRDIVTPGKSPTPEALRRNAFPIYSSGGHGGQVIFRYMRYWIEQGHRRAKRPLMAEEIDALDLLDNYLRDSRHRVSFSLDAGDIVYLNNKTVAHNRTAYRDTPENTRLLWRVWLDVAP